MFYLNTLRAKIKRTALEERRDATGLIVTIKVCHAALSQMLLQASWKFNRLLLKALIAPCQPQKIHFPVKFLVQSLKTLIISPAHHMLQMNSAGCFAALGRWITAHAVLAHQLISQLTPPICSFRNHQDPQGSFRRSKGDFQEEVNVSNS